VLPAVAGAQTRLHAPAKDSVRTLDSVSVRAERPLVTRKADRYIVQVENSFLSSGLTGLEVLQKSPGLWVSPNGAIRITGNQSVTVMINDVVQRMSSTELAEYLKTIRSEDISRIEVIANPAAEYEAASAGGIVHIILKKARSRGLNGTVYSQYRQQGSRPYRASGVMMDAKGGKWYASGGYSYSEDNSIYNGYTLTDYPDGMHVDNRGQRNNHNTRMQYRLALVYDISAKQSLSLMHNASYGRLQQYFYSGILQTGKGGDTLTGNAVADWFRRPRQQSSTAVYTWKTDTLGSQLKLVADYTRSSKQEYNGLTSVYSDTAASRSSITHTPGSTDLLAVQGDYTQAGKSGWLWRTGVKYVHTGRRNTMLVTGGQNNSNDFRYREDLLMGYLAVESNFAKWVFKTGLRSEQTWSSGVSLTTGQRIRRNYLGLFPSLFLLYHLNAAKGNSVQLNYTRKTGRPAFNDLNPYRLQLNDYSVLTGNPDLKPQYTHSLQAAWVWRRNYTAELYLRITNGFMAQTARTEGNIIIHQSDNYPQQTEWGLSVSTFLSPLNGWRVNNSLMVFRSVSDLRDMVIRRTSFSVKTVHTVTWKKVADIDVYAEYNSPYTSANARMAEYVYTEVGMARNIVRDLLRLRLSFADPLNTAREKELTVYSGTRIDFYQKRPTRTASVTLTWRFRSGKLFTKKNLDNSLSDEQKRIGG
jgi:hypothetical protein